MAGAAGLAPCGGALVLGTGELARAFSNVKLDGIELLAPEVVGTTGAVLLAAGRELVRLEARGMVIFAGLVAFFSAYRPALILECGEIMSRIE